MKQTITTEEFERCMTDHLHFIKTYCIIPHPNLGTMLVGEHIYQKQIDFINTIHDNQMVITNKCRQVGASAMLGCYALWLALFHRNKEVIIISIKDSDAKFFKKKYIDFPYQHLPETFKVTLNSRQERSMHTTELYTGSIITVASGKEAARGRTASLLVFDEGGFIPDMQEIYAAAYPSLSVGKGKCVINSTSSAIGTFYSDMWFQSLDKQTDFVPFIIEWNDVPHFKNDPHYLEKQRKNLKPESRFRREILREFLIDGDKFIPQRFIDSLKPELPMRADFVLPEDAVTPEEVEILSSSGVDDGRNYYKNLWYWKEPEKGHSYVISADVAEGSGNDYSTAQIIDVTSNDQVCEYRGKIDTFSFAKLLNKLGNYFNDAIVIVEYNSMGNAVFNKLHQDLKYENLYWRPDGKNGTKPGWVTSNGNRADVLGAFYTVVTEKQIKIRSRRLRDEAQNLVTIKNKVQAALGTNDDLVMAMSIGAFLMADSAMFSAFYDIGIDIERDNGPDDLMNQTPEGIKEFLQQETEYEFDDAERKMYGWVL